VYGFRTADVALGSLFVVFSGTGAIIIPIWIISFSSCEPLLSLAARPDLGLINNVVTITAADNCSGRQGLHESVFEITFAPEEQ